MSKSKDISQHTNRLSVQISLTGHSFLVTSINTNKVVFFSETIHQSLLSTSEVLEEIEKTIAHNQLLTTNIKDVHVIYNNDIATVVPAPLFDETKTVEYLKFNSKILVTDFVSFDTIENHDIIVVYVPYVNINNYFFETFGSFEYYHATTVFLKHVLSSEKIAGGQSVHVDVYHDTFTCIITLNGALLLCNTFSYKTPEDFIYYLLFCFEQLALNPDEIPVTLSGVISEENTLYEVLYTYIRTVVFTKSKPNSVVIDHQLPHNHLLIKSIY